MYRMHMREMACLALSGAGPVWNSFSSMTSLLTLWDPRNACVFLANKIYLKIHMCTNVSVPQKFNNLYTVSNLVILNILVLLGKGYSSNLNFEYLFSVERSWKHFLMQLQGICNGSTTWEHGGICPSPSPQKKTNVFELNQIWQFQHKYSKNGNFLQHFCMQIVSLFWL